MRSSFLALGLLGAFSASASPLEADFCALADPARANEIGLPEERVSLTGRAHVHGEGTERRTFLAKTCMAEWAGDVAELKRYILLDGRAELSTGDQITVRGNLARQSSPLYDGPVYHLRLEALDIEGDL